MTGCQCTATNPIKNKKARVPIRINGLSGLPWTYLSLLLATETFESYPEPGTPEARLYSDFLVARDWI
jgi:hypothetical protein